MKLQPSSNYLIRNAVMNEAEAIASVPYQAFAEFEPLYTRAAFVATTPTSDQIQKRWNEGPIWVVAYGRQIVGTVSAVPKPKGLYVRSMAVLPSHRGQKIGYMLLQAVDHFPNVQDIRCMFLSTTPFLKEAIQLYEQFGFHRTYDGPYELFGTPLFSMAMQLEPPNQIYTDGTNIPMKGRNR